MYCKYCRLRVCYEYDKLVLCRVIVQTHCITLITSNRKCMLVISYYWFYSTQSFTFIDVFVILLANYSVEFKHLQMPFLRTLIVDINS